MKLAVVGLGGIGSWFSLRLSDFLALEQLPGITEVVYFDADIFEDKNRWLQHLGLLEEALFQPKASTLAAIHRAKVTATNITAQDRFCTADDLLDFDIVVSCVDTAAFRRTMYTVSDIIHRAAVATNTQPDQRVMVTADLRKELKKAGATNVPNTVSDFWWIDLRSTGKTIAMWTKNDKNTLEELLSTLPQDVQAKGGCQTVQDMEARTYQNGSVIISQIGIQTLLQYSRNERTTPVFVFNSEV